MLLTRRGTGAPPAERVSGFRCTGPVLRRGRERGTEGPNSQGNTCLTLDPWNLYPVTIFFNVFHLSFFIKCAGKASVLIFFLLLSC